MSDKDELKERIARSLGDYVQVKERIAKFYELFGGGRLVTAEVLILTAPDNKQRVMVKALAYRTIEDPLPGVGYSWMELPGKTPYTNGSEIENAETSAWGRAIGSLGILIDASIATQNEIDGKAGPAVDAAAPLVDAAGETLRTLGPIERSGAIAKGTGRHSDLEWRQTPDGYHVGFLLEVGDGKARPQVSIEGPLAFAVYAASNGMPLLGTPITVRGELFEVRAPQRKLIYRIVANYIKTPTFECPVETLSVPMAQGAPAEPVEALPEPLGLVSAAEEAELAELPW